MHRYLYTPLLCRQITISINICPGFLRSGYWTQKARHHAKTLHPIHAYWLDSSIFRMNVPQLSRALVVQDIKLNRLSLREEEGGIIVNYFTTFLKVHENRSLIKAGSWRLASKEHGLGSR